MIQGEKKGDLCTSKTKEEKHKTRNMTTGSPPGRISLEPLVQPDVFLKKVNCANPRALALELYRRLQTLFLPTPQSEKTKVVKPSWFEESFTHISLARHFYEQTTSRVAMNAKDLKLTGDDWAYLPPLFLAASERFIYVYQKIILVAYAEGPIIPVVQSGDFKQDGLLQQLITIYNQSSAHCLSSETIGSVFTTPPTPSETKQPSA